MDNQWLSHRCLVFLHGLCCMAARGIHAAEMAGGQHFAAPVLAEQLDEPRFVFEFFVEDAPRLS
jgi:hypothetical protein